MAHLRNSSLLILLISISLNIFGQKADPRISYQEYVNTYKDIAIKKMHEYRIPASITLAQGILESGCGTSPLTKDANNHFGIKCHKEWTGMTYTYDDDAKGECFRKYATAEESFNDHSLFLTTRPRYSNLFSLDIKDYKGWAYGLKASGYATNPKYAEMLIRIIEENQLFLYDSGAELEPLLADNDNRNISSDKNIRNEDYNSDISSHKFKFIEITNGNRSIYVNNSVKLVISREGDNAQKIADDVGVHTFQILQYNDLGKSERIRSNSIIYVEPKKKKGDKEYHVVAPGETMRDISQLYAIKLKSLYKKNNITEGHDPEVGSTIYLRGVNPRNLQSDN